MLKAVVDAGVPVVVVFGMAVVGMELTAADFRRVAGRPALLLTALVGQWLALPAIGWLLVRCLDLQPATAQGLLLVAACPGGGMANVVAHLGRGDAALSVSLTAASCLAAGATTPLALAFLQSHEGGGALFAAPPGVIAAQLFLLLCLPILAGMALRRRRPEFVARRGGLLLRLSVGALLALLAAVVVQEAERLAATWGEIAFATVLLTALAFSAGWAVGALGGGGSKERFTVATTFVVRNVGIATAVAVTVLGRVEFAVFATAYFLAQTPLLLAAAVVFRSFGPSAGRIPVEAPPT